MFGQRVPELREGAEFVGEVGGGYRVTAILLVVTTLYYAL